MEMIREIETYITLNTLYTLFAFFIFVDNVTGLIKAFKNRRIKSRTLRNGLFCSVGELVLLAMAITLVYFIPVISLFIFMLIFFMALKELISILENLVEIGVRLPKWLIKGLKVYTDGIENLGEHEIEK